MSKVSAVDERKLEPLLFTALLVAALAAGVAAYYGAGEYQRLAIPPYAMALRCTALLATVLMIIVAVASPLARMHPAFRALRTHRTIVLVASFILAAAHVGLALCQTMSLRSLEGLEATLSITLRDAWAGLREPAALAEFPGEIPGVLALGTLTVAAVFCSRFWVRWLGRRAWRGLQQLIYPGLAMALLHGLLFGAPAGPVPVWWILAATAPPLIVVIHLMARFFPWRPQVAPPREKTATPKSASTPPIAPVANITLSDESSDPDFSPPGDIPAQRVETPTETPEFSPLRNLTGAYVLFICAPALALFGALQPPFDGGHRASGAVTMTGVYYHQPVAALYVTPDWPDARDAGLSVLIGLTNGAAPPETWRDFEGRRIRLTGTVLYRETTIMLDLPPDTRPEVLDPPRPEQIRPTAPEGEPVRMQGELLSLRCFLGAMWPGSGPAHRGCAVACLANGGHAGLLLRNGSTTTAFVLHGVDGAPLTVDPSLAGRIVRADGVLMDQTGYRALATGSITAIDASR